MYLYNWGRTHECRLTHFVCIDQKKKRKKASFQAFLQLQKIILSQVSFYAFRCHFMQATYLLRCLKDTLRASKAMLNCVELCFWWRACSEMFYANWDSGVLFQARTSRFSRFSGENCLYLQSYPVSMLSCLHLLAYRYAQSRLSHPRAQDGWSHPCCMAERLFRDWVFC